MKLKTFTLFKKLTSVFLTLFLTLTLHAATIYVGPGGDDSNSGISSSSPFLTIQKAIEYVANHGGPTSNNVILLDGSWSTQIINEVSACDSWSSNLLIQGEHSDVQVNVENYCRRLTFRGFKTSKMEMLRPADYCRLEDLEGVGQSWWEITASHITYLRCRATDDFYTNGDLIRIAADDHVPDRVPVDILFEDCCFKGSSISPGDHIDIIQIMGVSGFTMRNCKLWNAPTGLIMPTSINGVPLEHFTLENCYFGNSKLYSGQVDWIVTDCDFAGIVMLSSNNVNVWTGNRIRYLDKGVADCAECVFENNVIKTVGYEDGHRISLPPNNTVDPNLTFVEPPCPSSDPDVLAPSVPNGLSAGLITGSSIALSWNASTDDFGVTGYRVYIDGANPITVTGTSTTLSDLSPLTQYSLTVTAFDQAGNESGQSSALVVSTLALDTQAPSVPTGLAVGTVTTSSVDLSWDASSDNVGVTSYNVYINGVNPVNVTGTSTSIENLADNTQYSFTVSALDLEGNESAQSSAANATTLELTGVISSSSWQSFTESTQTGTFTATFDAVPSAGDIDAVTGIQNGVAGAYGDLACIMRFNSSGQIDARDGGTYTATNTVNYSAGVSYHFRVEIDIASHTYDVYVTPQGGSEQTVASAFAFRTEQATVTQLTGWSIYAYIGSHAVDNMTFTTSSGDTEAPSVPTALTAGAVTSSSVDLSWAASTDNVGVSGYKVYTDGANPVTTGSTSATISGLSPSTQYSFTVSAYDAAGNESTQSAAIQVTTYSLPSGGFYCDPVNGSMSNDGSESSPWSSLEDVISAGITFSAGDIIYLMNGDHGWPNVTQSNTGEVTITSYPGHDPVISRIDFNYASNWTIEGVRIHCSTDPPETPVLVHPVYGKFGNFLVRITESSYITLDNCYIYSIENSSAWTADDWNYKAWCGVFLYTNSDHTTIKNCELKNLNFAIDSKGTHSNTIQYNTIKNYCGDGLRSSTNSVIEYNEILDAYDTNGNHDDAMQAFASNGAIIRGNKIFSTTSATRPFISYGSQGIGFFDGWFDNYVIENNLIVIHHWHGLSLYGARNSKIVNNTVVKNPLGSSSYGPPWIAIFNHKDGTPSSGNIIANNLTSDLESTVGSTVSNNIVTTDYASHFTDYTTIDFGLQATSSAVDAGTTANAPTIDINQYPRSGNPDVGCYEYGSTVSNDLSATATADVTSGDAPLTVNFTGSASGGDASAGGFVESGGELVMEAENFTRSLTNSDVTNWEVSTTLSGYAGSGYITTPDDGVSNPGWGSACEAQYDIEISNAGTYNIWVYRYSPTTGSNSAYVGIDGVQLSNIDNDNNVLNQWAWANMGSVSISAGTHAFSIQRREDGYNIDKIILTTSSASPSGNAQAESSISAGYAFSWDFGDGNTSIEQNPAHIYTNEGNFIAVLTVSDGTSTEQDNIAITVTNPAGDTEAPTVPANLTAGTITATTVDLSWDAATDNVGVTAYKVYIDGANPVSVIGTSTSIDNLTAATQYSFTVSALDAAGNESAQSAAINVTTLAQTVITIDATIEAEDYSSQSGCSTSTLHSGYSGTGFLDYGGNGTYGEWEATLQGEGALTLSLRYANGSTSNRQCDVSVNGASVGNVSFSPTADWTTWDIVTLNINIIEGINTIRITANTSDGGPNLDKLDLDGEVGGSSADTEAPSVPTNIAVGTITGTTVDVSWDAASDNVGVTGYKVYVDGANPVSVTGTSTTISGLAQAMQYSFTVSALDDAGNESAQSSAVQATTLDTEAPTVPANLTVGTITGTTIDVNWDAASDNVGVTGYKVYVDGANPVSVTGTSTTITGLAQASQYSFTVSAIDAAGNESAQSSAVQATTLDTEAPTIPANLTVGTITGTTVDVSWDAATDNVGVTGYKVYVDGANPVSVTTTSTTISGLTQATQYSFTVSAIDAAGNESAQSSAVQATTLDTEAPTVPTGLAAGTITETSVALSWDASTDNVAVTGYKVYTDGANPTSVTGTSTTISGLTAATQYSFTVSAVDAAGNESAQSTAVQATTQSAVTNVTLNPVADAYVRGGSSENNNYGTDVDLAIKNNAIQYDREAYLKFDLSGIASPVTSAVLRLYLNNPDPSTHYLHFVSDDSWTETGITYANAPSAGSTIASWDASTTGFIEVDITSTVESEAGGMLSLHIEASNYSEWAAYDSREGTNKPELIIEAGDPGITSTSTWQSFDVSVQTETFTAEFDVVPNAQGLDNVIGIQNGVGDFWSDLACVIRFNTSNTIDARNGGSYSAATSVSYTAGTSYHFRLEIDVPSHTYSIYVTPQGQSEITLGTGYAFRTEQQSVTQLTGWSLQALSGSHTVRNMTFISGGAKKAVKSLVDSNALALTMYPNPNQGDLLYLNISGFDSNALFQMYDMSGKILTRKRLISNENAIDVSNLSKGIYIISVKSAQNSIRKKLIIK